MLSEGDLEQQQGSKHETSLKFTELAKHRIYRWTIQAYIKCDLTPL